MDIKELYDELEKHDWFFDFSDDHRVWTAGAANQDKLKRLAASTEGGNELYQAFHNHHFSGKPWNTEKAPKPERPQ